MSKTISESDVLAAWAALAPSQQPVVDTGGMTRPQLAEIWGLKAAQARTRIRELVQAGVLRQVGVRSTPQRSPVYEIVQKKGK